MRLSRTLVSVALSSAQLSAEYPGLEDILLYAFDKVGFFFALVCTKNTRNEHRNVNETLKISETYIKHVMVAICF